MFEAQPKMLLTLVLRTCSGAAIEVGVRQRKKFRLPFRWFPDPVDPGDGERAGVQGLDNLPNWTIVAEEEGRELGSTVVAAASPAMADDGLLAGK
jgi:hypothetical protein